ncbi:alpha/beta hydrolase [Deinococcus radiopugnans]|uniref:Alpha/beta hydrolase n=1 Tax=Deinococcus radiopugnans TaxID=57497 RepID=A0A0A7KG50_9DEIO|nr:alpha/beta hydrolase [Deinococcus radiopugnans]AIZ45075.1 alpha/beta hydrolase [Deinococcus radiopugnans]
MTVGRALYLEVNGLSTHAWVRGSGPPLVIVPGLGCASWMYVRVSRELARRRTVYVYDPPGHGYSQGLPHLPDCIEQLTDHLAAWLDVAGLKGAPIFGHSLGGEVAFDLAARYPQHAGALIACAPTGIPENPSVFAQLVRLLLDLPRERLGLLVPGLRAYAHCGVRRMLKLAHDQDHHDTGRLLPKIKVPTLLVDGTSDPVIRLWTLEAIRNAIPAAYVCQIEGGTHALPDVFPRAVARYTLDFLDAVKH